MSNSPAPRSSVPWFLLAVCLASGLVCYRLGIWQLDRLGQRRAQNALVRQRIALTEVDLETALASDDPIYRPVVARGVLDPDYSLYLTDRAREEQPGQEVIAPLQPDGGGAAILVDLGWIAIGRTEDRPPSDWLPKGPVTLHGILRASQTEPFISWLADPTPVPGAPPRASWRVLYIPGLQAQTPYTLEAVYLMLTQPPQGESILVPAPGIDLTEGPHLSYAIQWFAFGTTAIVGGITWARSVSRRKIKKTGA